MLIQKTEENLSDACGGVLTGKAAEGGTAACGGSFSSFTQGSTFPFAVFPGSFLIVLTLGKLLFCKIFLVTAADLNLTRKRITDIRTVLRQPIRQSRYFFFGQNALRHTLSALLFCGKLLVVAPQRGEEREDLIRKSGYRWAALR